MQEIKIIPPINLDLYGLSVGKSIKQKYVRGCLECFCKVGLFILAFFLFVMGLIAVLGLFGNGLWWLAIIMCLLFVYMGKFLCYLLIGRTYKPGKSFKRWRRTKEEMASQQKIYGIATIILAIIMLAFVFITGEFNLRRVLELIFGIIGTCGALYALSKSYKVHEDVDFVVNENVAKVLGFDIDEKVQCSYEDRSENRMLVVTNRRIFFVYEEKDKRLLLIKRFEELSKIGVYTAKMMGQFINADIGLVLKFTDSVQIQLKMRLEDNLTSNPDLFFKKFLVVLDDYMLGRIGQSSSSRRRVTVAHEPNKQVREEKPVVEGRSIDISDSIIQKMETAIPVSDNRNLEL